jgi:hypothetical protein
VAFFPRWVGAVALFTLNFLQIVVGEVDSLVMVWSLDTGEDVFTFSDTHRLEIYIWLHN